MTDLESAASRRTLCIHSSGNHVYIRPQRGSVVMEFKRGGQYFNLYNCVIFADPSANTEDPAAAATSAAAHLVERFCSPRSLCAAFD